MWNSDPELASAAATDDSYSSSSTTSPTPSPPPPALRSRRHRRRQKKRYSAAASAPQREDEDEASPETEAEDVWRGAQWEAAWPGRPHRPKPVVLAEDNSGVGRSRSLTDDDLEELKGCADLGFGFSYDEIPELRSTLPALELCYSMSQRLLDDHHPQPAPPEAAAPAVTNWKISSPGDSPDEVKARLKYWAQAVACTVRLCS